MKNNTPKKPSIDKESFIDFLAHAKPEEINQYIQEKGKPRKLISPMFFFDKKEDNKQVDKA